MGQLKPGETVQLTNTLDRIATSQINRLDCIVFSDLLQDERPLSSLSASTLTRSWTCKRVWGLPGEEVALRQGELWINGRMLQKSLDQLLNIAIPVADFPGDPTVHWQLISSTNPASATPRRETLTLKAGWQLSWHYHSHYPIANVSVPIDFDSAHADPVLDDYESNHATPRNLLPVDDLLLTVDFHSQVSSPADKGLAGHVIIECNYMGHSCSVECHFDKQFVVQGDSPTIIAVNPKRLRIGGWDGCIWSQWDNEPAFLLKSSTSDAISMGSDSPKSVNPGDSPGVNRTTGFTIRTVTGETKINRLCVERDLYLRYNERAPQNGVPVSTCLGLDEFYVIGDNLPISHDSRNGLGSVRRQQIVGVLADPRSE